MRKIIAVVVVIALLGGGAALLIAHKKRALAQAPRYGMQPMPVHVASARAGELVRSRTYLAVVQPIRVATVSSRMTGTVEQVLHDENDPVKAGDVLVVLDSRQIEESVAGMKAQVEQAQADLASNQATAEALERTNAYWQREAERDKTLAANGSIPGAQAEGTADKANEAKGKLDAARQKSASIERQIESLKRRQAELETQRSYCMIRSPSDGMVSNRMVDPGDMAVPGKGLMVVEDRSQFKLAFDVPQQDLPEVKENLGVEFTVSGNARQATLSHLYPSLNLARMLHAEVYLAGPDADGLSSGEYLSIRVVLSATKNAILVPDACIIESPGGAPYVFVVHAGQLTARPIKRLGSSGDEEAVEGVKAGEQVVRSTFLGWAQLSSGQKVEAME